MLVNNQNQLIDIIFDPIAWVDLSYLDINIDSLSLLERRIINQMLVKQLNFKPIEFNYLSQFEKEIIAYWRALPNVFVLMACYRYQAQILSCNPLPGFPINIANFLLSLRHITIKSATLTIDITKPLTADDLLQQAYREMLYFFPYLSIPLQQRAVCLFAESQRVNEIENNQQVADFLLLRIALSYAKSYQ